MLANLARVVLVGAAFGFFSVAGAQENINRPGGDYTSVTLPSGSGAAACAALCNADGGACKAWTYVRAGVQAPNPRCWLKNTVPTAQSSDCCVSGVKMPPMRMNVNLPGSDYTSVTLAGGATPGACRELCDADGGQCKAWTFVKAGVQASNPRCWLKNSVPPAQASDCCVSGTK